MTFWLKSKDRVVCISEVIVYLFFINLDSTKIKTIFRIDWNLISESTDVGFYTLPVPTLITCSEYLNIIIINNHSMFLNFEIITSLYNNLHSKLTYRPFFNYNIAALTKSLLAKITE